MNRNLLIFSVLLIALGFGLGLYLISFFGFLLLIPSLMATSRMSTRPPPTVPERRGRFQNPQRRAIPAPTVQRATTSMPSVVEQTPPPTTFIPPSQTQTPTYSLPLFPNAIFPAMNIAAFQAPVTNEAAVPKAQERDELLEIGTILAVLKLAFG